MKQGIYVKEMSDKDLITLNEIKEKFKDLIDNRTSREDVDLWASSLIKQDELNNLIYLPPEEEERIWEGITFLHGIDLQDSPGEYLHINKDIIRELNKLM